MTPEERAENILLRFNGITFSKDDGNNWLREKISAQIAEAVSVAVAEANQAKAQEIREAGEEVRSYTMQNCEDHRCDARSEGWRLGYDAGFLACREKAADMVRDWMAPTDTGDDDSASELELDIRVLTPLDK